MSNSEIAGIFENLYNILSIDEKTKFEALAYQRVARELQSMPDDVSDLYDKYGIGGLMKIPGVGKGIAQHIIEYLKTGKIEKYEKIKSEYPIDFKDLFRIEGLGPKKAILLYKKLGIKNLNDLKKAAEEHKIADIPGFGKKSEELILKNISMLASLHGRILLAQGLNEARKIISYLTKSDFIDRCFIAGSTRRMKETLGDIDILATSKDSKKTMDLFINFEDARSVMIKGETKTTILLSTGVTCDLRVINDASFGAALQYFTGSKDHNIKIRKIAIGNNYKLNEYGLFYNDSNIAASKDEKFIYNRLNMDYIPPEMREDRGEIELALQHRIPELISLNDIKGDLHLHTKESDGLNTTEEMVNAALEKRYEYIAMTNHTKNLKIAHGIGDQDFIKYFDTVDKLNQKYKIKILKGAEVDILKDGSLDLKDETLGQMDCVIASVHMNISMEKEDMTQRVINAIKTGKVNILGHPTGRLINKRSSYEIELDEVSKYCEKYKTALEINSSPERLDLNDENILKTSKYNVYYSINTDSHNIYGYDFMELGVGTARRGWLGKEKVINTMDLNGLMKFLKK
ncbi:bacterial/archaeal DNA polymerase X with 3 5 -exonuclease and AP-endonuclease activities [Ferroplasma acidiphilum]|uniref:DNA polymerase beta n=2 Tax=Ferroplasma acidiphilum TaxID=74969 RepID=A0A1V0N522_9ARCH|nr:DNA polymerase/3'-5' exonuclease PolX [Ferroplasma acidiphilum]ARD85196.1 bacterial/archaeal DNA polymerase X with 3 5 -exonuclease and AP-endonuclease activities [Ferroplasma acidiphilum]